MALTIRLSCWRCPVGGVSISMLSNDVAQSGRRLMYGTSETAMPSVIEAATRQRRVVPLRAGLRQ